MPSDPPSETRRLLTLTPPELFTAAYARHSHHLPPHEVVSPDPQEDLAAVIADCDVVLGDWTHQREIDAAAIASARQLLAIVQPTAGYEVIDVAAANRAGIPVANTPGANARAVAEWVVMAALVLLKRAIEFDAELRDGRWLMIEAGREGVFELADRTVGIVGFGLIGREVARRLPPFDVAEILYTDAAPAPPEVERQLGARRVPLDDLVARSDVITLHVPLLPETRHLLDGRRLAAMRRSAVLINTSRGPVVDASALREALRHGRIRGAGLDVFDEEPLGADHDWADVPRTLLSPHLAGSTNESRDRMLGRALATVGEVLRGRLPGTVVNDVHQLPAG